MTDDGGAATTTTCMWPSVFTDPNFAYTGFRREERAVADGLVGWANCMAKHKPPKTFGQGMVKVGRILGLSAIPENLRKRADAVLAERKRQKEQGG